jgi:hypothetical protein
MDLRGMSRVAIARRFASPPRPGSRRKFMTIAMPAGIADEARRKVMADLRAAVELVGERQGIGLTVSPRIAATRPPPTRSMNRTASRAKDAGSLPVPERLKR